MRAVRPTSLPALCALVVLWLTAPLVANAQDGARERAAELFEASAEAYRTGGFAEAARLLEEAYALHPLPVILYNLARAYESDGEYARAIQAYERYLADDPDASDRGAIERRIETLRAQVALAEEAAASPAPLREDTPASGSLEATVDLGMPATPSVPVGGIVLATIGGLLLASVPAMLVPAQLAHDRSIDAATTQRAAVAAAEEAMGLGIAGIATAALGALSLAVGIGWLLVGEGTGPRAAVALCLDRLVIRGVF